MSQICALIVLPSASMERVANSTPMVDLLHARKRSVSDARECTATSGQREGEECKKESWMHSRFQIELVAREAAQQVGLADAGVTNEDDCGGR